MLVSAFSLLLMTTTTDAFAGKVNQRNWKEHPDIMAIRRVKKRVQEGEKQPGWSTASENLLWCEESGLSNKARLVDNQGVIRRYNTEGAQGAIAFWTEQVYGPKGTLRWTFVRLFQTELEAAYEYKVFFDSEGKRIWDLRNKTSEAEADFDEVLPERWLITDPVAAWANPSPCTSEPAPEAPPDPSPETPETAPSQP